MELSNRKIVLTFVIMLAVFFITAGASLAFFSYDETSEATKYVKAGSVALHYNEKELTRLNLENALPMDETNGKKQDYFEFEITADTMNFDVPYVVTARLQGEALSRIPSEYVTVYLTEFDGTDEEQVLLTTYDGLTNVTKNNHVEQQLFTKTVTQNTSNYSKTFRLRMWINETANYAPYTDANQNRVYPMEDKTFSITLNVYSDVSGSNQQEPQLPPGLYTLDDQLIEDWDSLVARGMPDVDMNATAKTYITASLNEHNEEIGKLVCADTVRTIGSSTFYSYDKLDTVVLNEGVTTIGSGAFMDSTIKHVTFPTTLTRIDDAAFNRSKIEEADIYGTNLIIGDNAFNSCKQLTSVHLHSGVDTVGQNGFTNSTNLEELIIDDGVKRFNNLAFYTCNIQGDLVIPPSVTHIGYLSFAQNDYSTLQVLADDVYIDAQAFSQIPSLTTAYIKNGESSNQILTSNPNLETFRQDGGTLGRFEFSGDTSLDSITLSNVTYIGENLFNGSDCNLTTLVLPNTIEKIDNRAFGGCKLTEVTIPSGEIGSDAFNYGNTLTTVNIGSGVTKIGSGAFASNYSLATVNFASNDNLLDISGSAFDYTPWYNNQYNTNGYVLANRTLLKINSTTPIPSSAYALVASIYNNEENTITIPAQIRMLINDNYGEYQYTVSSFIFENPNNWYRYYPYVDENEDPYIAIDVSDPQQTAQDFKTYEYMDSLFFERRDN